MAWIRTIALYILRGVLKMRYIVGFIMFFAALMWFIMWVGIGSWRAILFFIDLPTALMFIILIVATIIISGEVGTFIKAKNALLSKKYYLSPIDREKAINLYQMLSKVIVATTILQVIAGAMIALGQIDSLQMLGPMLAVILISVFYGMLLLILFIYPSLLILKKRINPEEKRVISEKEVINKLLELCYKQNISPEEILEAEGISFHQQ